jgi:hypothetical protein
MLIDCDTCVARDIACDECVVAVLLRSPAQPRTAPTGGRARPTRPGAPVPPGESVELDPDEQAALGSLAYVGLVPPLRLIPGPNARKDADRRQPPKGRRGIA